MSDNTTLWTIDELCAQAAMALATDYDGVPNARIREVPDLRTLRYYTTLGLLDRPAEMKGRTGLYGRKHLLQVVAVKRLQTQGLSLAEIQQRLLGKSEKELGAIAQVSEKPARSKRREFWKRGEENPLPVPALTGGRKQAPPLTPPSQGGELYGSPPSEGATGSSPPSQGATSSSPPLQGGVGGVIPLQGIPLRDQVTLLIAPMRPLTPEDMQALHAAAGPLLKLLEKRRLLETRTAKETP